MDGVVKKKTKVQNTVIHIWFVVSAKSRRLKYLKAEVYCHRKSGPDHTGYVRKKACSHMFLVVAQRATMFTLSQMYIWSLFFSKALSQ